MSKKYIIDPLTRQKILKTTYAKKYGNQTPRELRTRQSKLAKQYGLQQRGKTANQIRLALDKALLEDRDRTPYKIARTSILPPYGQDTQNLLDMQNGGNVYAAFYVKADQTENYFVTQAGAGVRFYRLGSFTSNQLRREYDDQVSDAKMVVSKEFSGARFAGIFFKQ